MLTPKYKALSFVSPISSFLRLGKTVDVSKEDLMNSENRIAHETDLSNVPQETCDRRIKISGNTIQTDNVRPTKLVIGPAMTSVYLLFISISLYLSISISLYLSLSL